MITFEVAEVLWSPPHYLRKVRGRCPSGRRRCLRGPICWLYRRTRVSFFPGRKTNAQSRTFWRRVSRCGHYIFTSLIFTELRVHQPCVSVRGDVDSDSGTSPYPAQQMAVRMSAARLPWDRVNSWMLMTAFEIVGAGLVPASQDATDHAANAYVQGAARMASLSVVDLVSC